MCMETDWLAMGNVHQMDMVWIQTPNQQVEAFPELKCCLQG
jgi:hypothetical protein